MLLHLLAAKPTDSVLFGFLPAAARLGLDVVVLTDQPAAHERALAAARSAPGPGGTAGTAGGAGLAVRTAPCDVWDPRQLIAAMSALPPPAAVVTNSDHLQVQAALAAGYFGLPGKDWRAALRAKDKLLMRRSLAAAGIEQVAATEITPATALPVRGQRFPVVVKPATGVASEDVMLARDPAELQRWCAQVFARRPDERLTAEEYLPGGLRTVETLSDGATTWVLGGFATRLSPPPFFIEERLTWSPPAPAARAHVLAALAALGGAFGAAHTEVADAGAGTRIIEVNDRLIGDHGDFALGALLGADLFELVLRVHLGQPLPAAPPWPGDVRRHAVLDYPRAVQAGSVPPLPPAGPQPEAEPGVALTWWPWRRPGDRVTVTSTNRDYLGVITAVGPDPAAVERSVARLRTRSGWDLPARVHQ